MDHEIMKKAALTQSIQSGYTQFIAFLDTLPAERLAEPGAVGKWSVKDTLAHILVHEQRMLDWMQVRLTGRVPDGPQPFALPEAELDALNERIYQENRDRTLDEILAGLEAAHQQTLALIEGADRGALSDPGLFPLRDGEALWEAIAANTFWHFEEHERDLRAWRRAG
jgi:hypothetical protein